jgi:hypothetical protein
VWSVGSKVSDVYIGTRAFAVCEGGLPLVAADAEGFDVALSGFAQWLNVHGMPSRRRLRLWLSGGLCRPFIVPAVHGIVNDSEMQTVASAMAPQLTGLASPCVVFVERGVSAAPVVAVAVQEDRIKKIRDLVVSSARKPTLISIRPWWAEVLRHSLVGEPTLAALGVQDCDSMTVLIGRKSAMFETATTYVPVTDQGTAQSVLTRALLSSDVADGSELVGRLILHRRHDEGGLDGLALGCLAEFSR